MPLSAGSSMRVYPSRKSCVEPGIAESWSAVSFVVSGQTSSGSGTLLLNRTCLGLKRNGMLDCVMAPNCGGSVGWLGLAGACVLSPNGQRDEGGQKKLKAGSVILPPRAPSFA